MSTGVHEVVVWVRPGHFTLTARKPAARLGEVEGWVKANGYKEVFREGGLTKKAADRLKADKRLEYGRTLAYRTRPPLAGRGPAAR